MPIEIKELVIRAVVEDHEKANAGGGAALTDDQRHALVDSAVKEVLRILKKSKER